MERYLNWSSHVLWGEEDRKQGTQIGKEGRNSDKLRKRKALLRSREFAVVVGGGGGAAAACWVVVVVDETGKEKGIRRNRVWGRRNRVCGYGGYWLSGFCVYRVLEKFRGCLVYVFKQQFLVFKQHFTHSNVLFHPHVFPQMFLNNNFQFLNTHTKQGLNVAWNVVFFNIFFFLNIVLKWEIVGDSEVSVLYIYIY